MIPFLNLANINSPYEEQILKSIKKIIKSGWYIKGEEVKNFENEYATFCGTTNCIGVANGLDALSIIIKGYKELGKLQDGDEVIVPANTYIASILAITNNNLKPLFIEPHLTTYNIDISKIEEKITSRTKAIMAVHLYGKISVSDEMVALVERNNLILIEDAAQSQGAIFSNTITSLLKIAGGIGHAAGHSFYPGKNLGCLGDGGAITTNDNSLTNVVRALANYGSHKKYENIYQGVNSRLDEIQAAILRVKLPHLNAENQKRRELAHLYCKLLKDTPLTLPCQIHEIEHIASNTSHIWHLFVVRTNRRNELQHFLQKNAIETLIHYPIAPTQQQAYKEYNRLQFPITEEIHKTVLSLPLYPTLKNEEIEYVCTKIKEFYGKDAL